MQLVGDVHNPNLQSHFLRMAKVWSSLAVSGPSANSGQELPNLQCARHDRGKLSGHAILIVEDDQLLKLLIVDIVENAGFVAHHAGNADEAVAILESRSDIALLLTDINMPGSMDGLKLAHAVRNRWQPIKIIVVSSRVTDHLPTDSPLFRQALSCWRTDFRDAFSDWLVIGMRSWQFHF